MCVVRQPPPPKVVHDKMETTVCLTVVDLQRYEGVNINVQYKKISNVIYQGRSMQECVALCDTEPVPENFTKGVRVVLSVLDLKF